MTNRHHPDTQPESEFQRRANDLLARRLAATSRADRLALEAELAEWLRLHRERNVWDAVADAEAVEQAAGVPHGTSRDRSGPGAAGSGRGSQPFDYKLAQAGERSED